MKKTNRDQIAGEVTAELAARRWAAMIEWSREYPEAGALFHALALLLGYEGKTSDPAAVSDWIMRNRPAALYLFPSIAEQLGFNIKVFPPRWNFNHTLTDVAQAGAQSMVDISDRQTKPNRMKRVLRTFRK